MSERCIRVAVPVPLNRCFDYLLSADMPEPCVGGRVRVPFGRRQLVAVVTAIDVVPDIAKEKLKSLIDVIDTVALFDGTMRRLMQFASDFYVYPLGEIYATAMPKWLRDGRDIADIMKKYQVPESYDQVLAQTPLTLNQQQHQAVTAINQSQRFDTYVLQGVTGSGKTEVYMHAIADVLVRGQSALVLIPEISLTPQTVARFQQRFSVPMVALHSGLSHGERVRQWLQAYRGDARLVIGTRSTIFVPIPKLALIVIDEEHDGSFAQQSGLRYHARQLAIMRANYLHCPVVLGSATPSLSTLANVEQGRFHLLRLTERAGGAKMPRFIVNDIRAKILQSGLSEQAIQLIRQHLQADRQVLVFLNRRGFAPVLMCHHCGYAVDCPHCERHMTWHDAKARALCHHCGYRARVARICPQCQQADLAPIGIGTEQLESVLAELFPKANVMRIDRDTTRGKDDFDDKLAKINRHDVDILLGTQMLAKGHHFAQLGLVVMLDLDAQLYSADLSAMETLGQLILQVAGRAGREGAQGEVLLQTHEPEHYLVTILLKQGYEAFAKALLQERRDAQLPPYSYMAKVVVEAKTAQDAERYARITQQNVPTPAGLRCVGPMPAVMEKRASWYAYEIILMTVKRPLLHHTLHDFERYLSQQRWGNKAKWSLQLVC